MGNILGEVFGFMLGSIFTVFGNYGVSIIIFTVLASIVLFPLSVRKQKNMFSSVKYEIKKEELRKKYVNNPQKYNEELMNLTQREGINPMKGCLNLSFITTLILFSGIYSTIFKPLTGVLNLPDDKVKILAEKTKEDLVNTKSRDSELQIIKNFSKIQEYKNDLSIFTEDELNKIKKLSKGFNFLGLNLLNVPKTSGFLEFLWILPLLCLLISIFSVKISQKISGTSEEIKGFGKVAVYFVSLFQAWLVFTLCGAVGLYLIVNNILNVIQMVIIEHYFSVYITNARLESKFFKKLCAKETKNF
ncbi:MAG: YidC/Oxa1 family membrane protein insertase [Candidatus Improbicoccus devescovinae]|nr:MAG: YidC/Oxa1 family membrane protein insertase [Candidatus Improbicoccus devescovinae]